MNTDSVTFWIKTFFFTLAMTAMNGHFLNKALRTGDVLLEKVSSVAAGLNIIALILIILVIFNFRKKDGAGYFSIF